MNVEPLSAAIFLAATTVLSAAVGACLPVRTHALADSIDRRAGLKNLLVSSIEIAPTDGIGEHIHTDAESRVSKIKPSSIFKLGLAKRDAATLLVLVVATSIFLLGNSPILMSEEAKRNREALKERAALVKHLTKVTIDAIPKDKLNEKDKRLADELKKLESDLEKAKKSPEELAKEQSKAADKANEYKNDHAKSAIDDIKKAHSALEAWKQKEVDKSGPHGADAAMAQLSDEQRNELNNSLNKQLKETEKDLKALQSKLSAQKSKLAELKEKLKNPNLSAAERAALEKQMKDLESQIAAAGAEQANAQKAIGDLQKQIASLKLSPEALESFRNVMNDPAYVELQKLAEKLAKQMQNQQNDPAAEPPTKEELEEMRQKLEELAKQLRDPEALKEYLDALRKALEEGRLCHGMGALGFGLGGLSIPGLPGAGAATMDIFTGDTGKVNHTDKPEPGQGTTHLTPIRGSRREIGPDTYIEIKAPTTVGNRSSVPYRKVLPQYKQKAEAAMNRQEIPKAHQKRVKEYFESLGK